MELFEHFLAWHNSQPVWIQLYVDYVVVRGIAVKFVSDKTKAYLFEPLSHLCGIGLKYITRPLTDRVIAWYGRRTVSSEDLAALSR